MTIRPRFALMQGWAVWVCCLICIFLLPYMPVCFYLFKFSFYEWVQYYPNSWCYIKSLKFSLIEHFHAKIPSANSSEPRFAVLPSEESRNCIMGSRATILFFQYCARRILDQDCWKSWAVMSIYQYLPQLCTKHWVFRIWIIRNQCFMRHGNIKIL